MDDSMIAESMINTMKLLNNGLFMSDSAHTWLMGERQYWSLLYASGHARFNPRIKNQKRKRRIKNGRVARQGHVNSQDVSK